MTVYSGSSVPAYYPGGLIGDVGDISIDGEFRAASHSGHASLRIGYRPAPSGGQGWAGVYLLYPDHNWGQLPGRNLAGATKLTFWVCADHDTRAEFLVGGIGQTNLPYFDSLPKTSTGMISVSTSWQRHEIDLKGRDLSSVIRGFAVVTSRAQGAEARALFSMMSRLICQASTSLVSSQAMLRRTARKEACPAPRRSMTRRWCCWPISHVGSPMISDAPN